MLASGGKSDTWTAAKIRTYQAMVDLDGGQTEDAIQLAARAVALLRKLGGEGNPQLATGELCLGLSNLLAGDAAGAEAEFRSALEIRKHTFPQTHRDFLLAQVRLAEALLDEDRTQDAFGFDAIGNDKRRRRSVSASAVANGGTANSRGLGAAPGRTGEQSLRSCRRQ